MPSKRGPAGLAVCGLIALWLTSAELIERITSTERTVEAAYSLAQDASIRAEEAERRLDETTR